MRALPVIAVAALASAAFAGGPPSLSPVAMRGPFPSIEKACAALEGGGRCRALRTVEGELPAPMRAVSAVERRGSGRSGQRVTLAVRTDEGWFVEPGVAVEESGRCSGEVTLDDVGLHVFVEGEPARALLKLRTRGSCAGGFDAYEYANRWDDRAWILGGVGPSQRPSATPPILVAQQHRSEELRYATGKRTVKKAGGALTVRVQPGTLEVAGPVEGLDTTVGAVLPAVGVHPVVFP